MDPMIIFELTQSVLAATWRMATPIIYTSIGEVFSERSGVLNIGLEGIMLFGAFSAFATTFYTGSLMFGLLAAMITGLLLGLLFALFTVTIKANQIVVGAAFNMIGLGITGFLYRAWFSENQSKLLKIEIFPPIEIPVLSQIPFIGEILFKQNAMVYATVIVVVLAAFILYKTAFGLYLRSVGEHPKAADTVGINVARMRYVGVIIGGILAAIGGAFLTLAHANQFVEGITTGRGFIALAVVVFGRYSPWGALGASVLFGVFFALQLRLQTIANAFIPYQFFQALPYLVTLLVLLSLRNRSMAPKALGVPYK